MKQRDYNDQIQNHYAHQVKLTASFHSTYLFMISIVRLLRLTQRSQNVCCRLARTPSIIQAAFKGRQTPIYWSSTFRKINDATMPYQNVYRNGQEHLNTPQKTVVLSAQAQRAVWACKVIQMIRDAEDPIDMNDCLKKRLLSAKIDTTNLEFDLSDEFRNDILQMFTIGKQIDYLIYRQSRIMNPTTQEKKCLKRRLVFYPTTIVSKLVFNAILKKSSTFLLGSSGIGKTISFVLYGELAQNIHKLVFLAEGRWIPHKQQENYRAELQLLKQKKLIFIPPKCWYSSIDRDIFNREEWLVELIRAQTKEYCLEGKQRKNMQKAKSMDQLISSINNLNSLLITPVQHLIIMDQINFIVFHLHKWNYFNGIYQQTREAKSKDAQNAYTANKQLYLNPSKNAHTLLAKFKKLSSRFILSSPFQFQENLLFPLPNKRKLSQMQHLKIIDGEIPNNIKISYGKMLRQNQSARLQFNHLFIMTLEHNLRLQGASPQIIEKVTSKLSYQPIQIKSYYRPLSVSEYFFQRSPKLGQMYKYSKFKFEFLSIQKALQCFRTAQDDINIRIFLTELKDNYQHYCIQNMKIRLSQYMDFYYSKKQEAMRRLVIHCIRLRAKKLNLDNNSVLKFNIQDLQNDLREYIQDKFDIMGSLMQIKGPQSDARLPFKYCDNVLEFEWSVQEFLQISQGQDVLEMTQQRLKFYGGQLNRHFLINNRAALGTFMELSLARIIQHSSGCKFQSYSVRGKGIKKAIQSYKLYFQKPAAQAYFQPINTDNTENKSNNSIYHNFKAILEQAKARPGQYILGTPCLKDDCTNIVNYGQRNNIVDFALINYTHENNQYEINTFGVIINTQKVTERAKQAQKMWSQLKSFEGKSKESKFAMKHIIVCHKQACKNKQVVERFPLIEFAALQQFAYAFCRDQELEDSFETAKALLKL